MFARRLLVLACLLWVFYAQSQAGNFILNSYVYASQVSPVLDAYPASAAYSLRKLSTSYNSNVIQVRRTDGVTQDVGFSGLYLDTVALKNFCGSQDCFVRAWYDQSGNSRTLTQTTLTLQPLLVQAGVILRSGGEPAVFFDGVNDQFRTTFTIGSVMTRFIVMTHLSPQNNDDIILDDGATADRAYLNFPSANTLRILNPGGTVSISPVANAVQFSSYNLFNASSSEISYNNSSVASGVLGSTTYNGVAVATRGGLTAGYWCNMYLHELIIYSTNQSANRVAINTNINSFYSIN